MRRAAQSEIRPGSVVQLAPETNFPGCFLLVTEVKGWGVQGFVAMPQKLGEPPGEAYYRATWDACEYIGQAAFVPADLIEDCESGEAADG